MRLLLIHQAFATPDQPGGTRHFEFARALVEQGHAVTVVASTVNYLTGGTGQGRAPSRREEIEGVRILRAYTSTRYHRSLAWRVFAFLTFMLSSLWAGLCAGPVDLVMGTSPSLFQALSAWAVARLRRRPFLLEIRDLWPEFAVGMGALTNPLLIALARRLEAFLYAAADHILVNSPAYRSYLLARGVDPERVSLIANGADPEMFDPADDGAGLRQELGLGQGFLVTYAGAMGPANDLEALVEAAWWLRRRDDITLVAAGDGKDRPRLEALTRGLGLANLRFVGPLAKARVPDLLAASDACLAILQDIPMFRTTYPNKVFDYMAAGRPVVLAIDGVIREVVEAAGAGVAVAPGGPRELARAIARLCDHPQEARAMGRKGREALVRGFNRRLQAREFVDLALRVAEGPGRGGWYRRRGKRCLDVVLTLAATPLWLPFLLALTGLVRWRLGPPALFCQARPGRAGRSFVLRKLRTMTDQRGPDGALLPDRDRLTPLGFWLRATSLDELPELVCVLRGEMSLVGPRPLLTEYLPLYSPAQARRHLVLPGITGLAQIMGRNELTWQDKFSYDTWYVDHLSLALDLKILALTGQKVISRQGITSPGSATAEKFRGNGG